MSRKTLQERLDEALKVNARSSPPSALPLPISQPQGLQPVSNVPPQLVQEVPVLENATRMPCRWMPSGRCCQLFALLCVLLYLLVGCELGLPFACILQAWIVFGGLAWAGAQLFGLMNGMRQLLGAGQGPQSRPTKEAVDADTETKECVRREDLCEDQELVKLQTLEPKLQEIMNSEQLQSMLQAMVGAKIVTFLDRLDAAHDAKHSRGASKHLDAQVLALNMSLNFLQGQVQDIRQRLDSVQEQGKGFADASAVKKEIAGLQRVLDQVSASMKAGFNETARELASFNATTTSNFEQLDQRMTNADLKLAAHASSLSLLWYNELFLAVCALSGVLALHVVLAVFSRGQAPFAQLQGLWTVCRTKPLEAIRAYWSTVLLCAMSVGVALWHLGVTTTGWIALTVLGVHVAYALVFERVRTGPAESAALNLVYCRIYEYDPRLKSVEEKLSKLTASHAMQRPVAKVVLKKSSKPVSRQDQGEENPAPLTS